MVSNHINAKERDRSESSTVRLASEEVKDKNGIQPSTGQGYTTSIDFLVPPVASRTMLPFTSISLSLESREALK